MRSFTSHRFGKLVRPVLILGGLSLILTFAVLGVSERSGLSQGTAQTKRPQDYKILIAGYAFDPVSGAPQIPDNLRATAQQGEAGHYIIQFSRSLTRAERERIKRVYGLRLTEYIPNLSFLEKVSAQTLAGLRADPLHRASVVYEPAFKISPKIGEAKQRSARRQRLAGFLLRAILFPDADPSRVLAAIQRAKHNTRGSSSDSAFPSVTTPTPRPAATPRTRRRVPSDDGQSNYPPDITQTKIIDERKFGGQLKIQFVLPSKTGLAEIARLEEVRWIEEVPEINYDNGNTAGTIQSGTVGTTPIWDQGIRGEGQIVGVIDSRVDVNHCMFEDPVDNTVRPAHRKVVGFRATAGAGDHGTFVAGIAVGDDFNNLGTGANRGMAWAARLTYDSRATAFLTALADSAADGARIHTNSWHEEPEAYNQTAADADTFVWNNEDHLILGSSGNDTGTETIGPPGTAKNALCVSASDMSPNQMNFGDGNNGPATGARRKPEIFAPGCSIISADAGTACGIVLDSVVFGFGPICATSWATPATAGTAALVRQYYTEGWYPSGTRQPHNAFTPSGALIKATLLNATIDMTGIAGYPGNREGWGLLRLNNTLFFPGSPRNVRVWDTRNESGLNTGDARTHNFTVASAGQPLRVTLVWSDAPAAATDTTPLVNDLDLVLTSPDGTQTFIGNDFAAGVTPANSGAAPDNVNNVEMIVINNPAIGNWTITVNGTTVNVGNPGQGYALVATADLTDPPAPTGNQDTLVVRVKYSDIATTPSLPNLQNLIDNDVVNYFNEVTYGRATIAPDYLGPINLDHEKAFYTHPSRSLLIEMTEEVIAKLVAADANVFTKGTPGPADDVDRLILVTNDEDFSNDWATTGPWPYDLPGGLTRPLSVSIQTHVDTLPRFVHGLGHQFGLADLYNYPGVTFARPAYADEWDNMAKPFRSVHYLTWEKERATWINSPVNQTRYVPRPAGGTSSNDVIPLFFQESTGPNTKAIAIGTTNGAAALANEDVFYFVEARNKVAGSFDNDVPSSGVLIYFVNERIPQGQGPVILLDKNPGTDTLADAAFQVGDSRTIPGTGITVTVQAGTAGADFNIQVGYTPPVTDYNVRITKGDTRNGNFYPYYSPDIWFDSPRNGLGNLAGGPPAPTDPVENPVIGMVNNICARVSNDGPGTAFDFDVRIRISEPAHTVGGELDFDTLVAIRRVASLASGASTVICVPWTPADDGNSHSCVWVDFINLVGTDTNQFDNAAQENFETATSVTSSPFHPVVYPFDLTNPYAEPALMYFRAEGVPAGWAAEFNPKKILLNPGQRVAGTLTIKPPPDAQVCTSEVLQITSWTPRGDTLVNVGGAVVQVDLRKNTLLTLDTRIEHCRKNEQQTIRHHAAAGFPQTQRFCERVVARGCTNPPMPNQVIILRYVMPDGTPIYHEVTTDAMGCYEDFVVSTSGGDWKVTAEFEGAQCQGPATVGPRRWNCCKPIR